MIAKFAIKDGEVKLVYLRQAPNGEQKKIKISEKEIAWKGRWHVTLQPEGIFADSNVISKKGGNTVKFEARANGFSELSLRKTTGEGRTIKFSKIFEKQNGFNGDLSLIFNSSRNFRFAKFESEEYLTWLRENGVNNVLDKNLETYFVRNKKGRGKLTTIDGCSAYIFDKIMVMTDGVINIHEESVQQSEVESSTRQIVSFDNATWAVVDKLRTRGIERVLCTQESVFGLRIPSIKKTEQMLSGVKTPSIMEYSKMFSNVGASDAMEAPEKLQGIEIPSVAEVSKILDQRINP